MNAAAANSPCTSLFESEEEEQAGQAEAWKYTFAFVDSLAVKSVVLLGIPDIIARHGPKATLSLSQIAAELPTQKPDVNCLFRILRFLVAKNFFRAETSERENEVRYGLTPASKWMLKDGASLSMSAMLLMQDDVRSVAPLHHLNECILEGGVAFEKAHGLQSWDYAVAHPQYSDLFNQAMACNANIVMKAILSKYEGFQGLNSLVDVGGGIGATVGEIVKAHPTINGINYDLPHVIATAPHFTGVKHVGGDMFKEVPSADAVFMKWVLHDWGDEDCVKILKQCRKAIPETGKSQLLQFCVDPRVQRKDSGPEWSEGLESDVSHGGYGDPANADAAHGGYDDVGKGVDDDVISSYVNLMYADDNHPTKRRVHTMSWREPHHLTSIPQDVSASFIGVSDNTEVGSSSRSRRSITEAQPHIPLAFGLSDDASCVRPHPSVTLATHQTPYVDTTITLGMAMRLSQMQPSTLSFEDLTPTTFFVHESGPPHTTKGITEHSRMEGTDTDIADTQDGASQEHIQQDDASQSSSRGRSCPAKSPTYVNCLFTILRFLVANNFFRAETSGGANEVRYGLTPSSKWFVKGGAAAPLVSMASRLLMQNDVTSLAPWHRFNECILHGGVAFQKAHGLHIFYHGVAHPEYNDLFNQAMACNSNMVIKAILSKYEGFQGLNSLVDVGGGIGATIAEIVKAHPTINDISYDLPHLTSTTPYFPGINNFEL
ncbi:hypothetical protein SUGI_0064630 [Cryptomeria japonica]|nr:hypothetical protein SUGI_0064630 [Cryptomeria japonica]